MVRQIVSDHLNRSNNSCIYGYVKPDIPDLLDNQDAPG